MKTSAFALAIALAAPFGVAACGGDDKSDEDQVRDVIELVNDRDPDVCDKLTDKYRQARGVEGESDCEREARRTRANAIRVRRVAIDGETATVAATLQGQPGELLLVKDGDDWKLDEVRVAR